MATQISQEHLDAWRGVLNVHAALTGNVERALSDAGLPPLAWYDVLWALYRAPGRRLRMGTLADEVTISRSGLTRLVDRIEAEGMLERTAAPEDRRAIEVAITPAGARMLRRMWPVYERVLQDRFERELSKKDARALAELLARAI